VPQAYSVHPPQAKEQQNNPLSSSSSTIPYNVKEINNSKKRRVVHGPCTQSKKPKIVDPDLSLPEESDMDNNIRDLLHNDSLNESDDDSTLKDDNEDIDDMLQALSNEVEGLDEKGPPVRENLAKCINNIWNKPLTKEKYVEKLKKQKMPANLNLNIKRCNSEIWKNMVSTGAKTKDLKLQKIQTAISKTSAGLISNANELMALGENKDKFISKKELKTVIEKNVKATLEATTILAGANSFTNDIRREEWKTSMRSMEKPTWRDPKNYSGPHKGLRGQKRGKQSYRGKRSFQRTSTNVVREKN